MGPDFSLVSGPFDSLPPHHPSGEDLGAFPSAKDVFFWSPGLGSGLS